MPIVMFLDLQHFNSIMKQSFLVFAFFIVAFVASAQTKTDSVKYENKRQDMMYIDLSYERLNNTPDGIKQRWFNRGIGVGFMYDQPLAKSAVSLAIGVGFSSQNIYGNGQPREALVDSQIVSTLEPFNTALKYTRNKFVTSYLDIPFELRFRFKPTSQGYSWKFAVGAKVGYLFDVHTTFVNAGGKYKVFNYSNFTQWRYGVELKAGYGKAQAFVYYPLTYLFEDGPSQKIKPLTIGIQLTPF